ncbi:DNA polymerase III subunit gamma/tau [Nitrosophilus kaiyonis]|uniref:DNA polymerase III subunit gamma/tau n=1 Tax=Nitrosophilus kaiyonis TaxID=2930200 RepID=UPI002490D7B7|nr:DNA polymerase III subunit gamma/tau [Nitrosophilus kaiyonis]
MSKTLALKYRPKRFEDLIGQDSIAQTLSLALDKNHLSHAYLFSGLRGSGKTSTARIFSKALICDKGPTSKPCETCENCKAANENRHIDIIEMDAASSRKIDDIRDLIEQTKYKPAQARFKIFIIDEVHMLTKEAFNALLKTLEEPPEYVKFILATTDPLKLPATILSRTQHFRFKKIAHKAIVSHLAHILNLENVDYEEEALHILARSGSGSLRDTLTLLDQAIIYSKNFVNTQTVTEMLGLVDPKVIEDIFKAVLEQKKEKIKDIVENLRDYEASMVIDEMIIFLKERLFEEDIRFSTMILDRFFRILNDAKNLLFINADEDFVLTITLFKMIEALKIKEIDEIIDEVESQKEEIKELPSIKPEIKEIKSEKKESIDYKQNFQKLIQKIYDRDYELGKCFEENVKFVSFENNILTWESAPKDECKKTLKNAYGIIRHFVQDIFGIDTKIKKVDPIKEAELHANEDCSSMIEKVEGGDSCISNTLGLSGKEMETKDILHEPMVKKAKELFNAKRVIVKPKV